MKRGLLSAFLVAAFLAPLHAKGPVKQLEVYDFSKGVDTFHATASLPDGFTRDSLNGLYDDAAPFTKRAGYTVAWSTKSYQYTGLWTYVDPTNTTWQITRSSDQITARSPAGLVVKVATVTVSNTIGETNAFGFAYFVDQSQGVYYWNGSSMTSVASSPLGSFISQFHQRLWVSGVATPNGNQLYGSKFYDGNTWTTGVNATDPVQYSIGLNDNFDTVSALYVYLDTLYTFKHYATFALTGFDQTNFQITQLTQECGCIDQNTIQTYNGGLKFVSLRGVENFNGYSCTRISDPVKNKVDPATLSAFSAQSWVQASQSDFQSGASSPTTSLSFTINPGYVVPSSFSVTENSSTQWANGTASNVTVNANSIVLTTNNSGNINDPSFEGGSGSSFASNWVVVNNGSAWARATSSPHGATCTTNPQSGSAFAVLGYNNTSATLTAYILNAADNAILLTKTFSTGTDTSCAWVQDTLSSTGLIGKRIKIQFKVTASINPISTTLTTNESYVLGGDVSFYREQWTNGAGAAAEIAIDNIQNGSSTITNGSFTSQAFYTALPYGYVYTAATWAVDDFTPSFVLQQSTSSLGKWSDVTTSTGVHVQVNDTYLRYLSTFTVTPTGDALSTLSSISLTEISSGTYFSAVKNAPSLNSWGNFTANYTSVGGAHNFFIRSSTSPFYVLNSSPPWTSQTVNAVVAGSTGTYFQVIDSFTITSATDTIALNDFTVSWFEGTRAPPMASTVWDNRYWLSLTTTTADAANDAVLVLNSRGAWAIYDIHAGGFTQTRNALYHADSRATGNIYQDILGYSDNGSAINSYVRTKDYSLGDISRDHYLDSIYASADYLGACDVTFQYTPDKSTATFSLGTIPQTEFATVSSVRLPVPINTSYQNFGRTFNFTMGSNDALCPLQLYGLRGLYRDRPNF